ncbi:hypothetical protein L9F63_014983 [Diploptera punctata]|uniref:Y+L amino acid transporter 2 n=1 Tax=Diploptera punctata TaxID=6984 RepID=A0AAD8A6P4_DIPPU|nr:hypothetical protein L9F63_014983 [Diploptera punctata]
MSATPMLNSPTSVTTMDERFIIGEKENDEKVRMKKQLGLLEGVAIIIGIIFGSGIFISPTGVIQEVGSPGFSVVIWMLCGLLSMVGALCYAELGTSIPKSGGDYAYIFEAFGPLPAFLYLWDAMLIFVPTTNAIMGLTFASYVIQPFFPTCKVPDSAVRLLAATTICFLTFINCYDVKLTTRLQNVFMFAKIGALVIIIIAGITYLILGNTENLENPFEGSTSDASRIAVSFCSGIFSYSGWNYLNFMTEELKDPFVNLPRAIYISLPLVTLIYVFANIAYLAVLTPTAMIASNAIAVTFGDQVLGVMAWIMPVMVAISIFGGLSVHIMTSSRMCFVGARYGHFPAMLSHIHIKKYTPTPSLIFLNILSLIMLSTSDIYLLINYSSIVETVFIMLSVDAFNSMHNLCAFSFNNNKYLICLIFIYFLQVSLWVPIAFLMVCLFLVVILFYAKPFEVGMGILITLSGFPAFYFGVIWKKPEWFEDGFCKLTCNVQKLFLAAKEE